MYPVQRGVSPRTRRHRRTDARRGARTRSAPLPKSLTLLAGDFDATKHPRAEDGQFGTGAGDTAKAAAHHAHAKESLEQAKGLLDHYSKDEAGYQKAFERNGGHYFAPGVEANHTIAKARVKSAKIEVDHHEKQVLKTRKRLAIAHHAAAQRRLEQAKARAAANPSPEATHDIERATRGVAHHAKRANQ